MPNYYNSYQRVIIDEVVKYTRWFYPGQMLSFSYGRTTEPKIVLSIGVWENKLHCLKLNEVNPNTLSKEFRYALSQPLISKYETAISYGVYDEALRMNEYQLPLKIPRLNKDTTAKFFYESVVRGSRVLKSNQVYRTYLVSDIKNLRVVVPDLQKLGILDSRIKRQLVSEQTKKDFLKTMKEVDDYTLTQKFDAQDEQFD